MSWKPSMAKNNISPEERKARALHHLRSGEKSEGEIDAVFYAIAAFGSSQDGITYQEAYDALEAASHRPDMRRRENKLHHPDDEEPKIPPE